MICCCRYIINTCVVCEVNKLMSTVLLASYLCCSFCHLFGPIDVKSFIPCAPALNL